MMDRGGMSPRATRNAWSAALIVVGALALYNWALSPHLGYLHAVQRFGAALERVAEEKDGICATIDEKIGLWRTLQGEAAELDMGLFTPEQARAFVRGLLPLVEESGCVVVLGDFSRREKGERVDEPNLPVVVEVRRLNLSAAGRPDQISTLLRRLGNHRPKVWLDACRFDFLGEDAGQVECHLVLTFYTALDRMGWEDE